MESSEAEKTSTPPPFNENDLDRVIKGIDLEITEATDVKENIETSITALKDFEPKSKEHKFALQILLSVARTVVKGLL